MGNTAVQQILYLMDEAFDSRGEHALLTNLSSVKDDEWRWVPAGGGRSIIQHDLYHAGEINHIRSLRQETDKWAWQLGQ